MQPMPVLDTVQLYLPLHHELITLLRGLEPGAWERPTVAGSWRVRDVAAHLLDVDLRKLSIQRDGHSTPPPGPIEGYDDLVRFLNGLNAQWVDAARRLSPRVLVELLAFTGPMVADLVASLTPHEPSLYPVSWAGEDESQNWLDIGRDYTERWHHQMQIRDAVGAPGLLERRWIFPLLDLSVRALPHAYRSLHAPDGTSLVIQLPGEDGDAWSLVRAAGRWQLGRGSVPGATAIITLDPDSAWRLLYNALPPDAARRVVRIEGDAALAEPLFSTRSVMV
jgi:uncharacterized protein (TIGR03083 family)